jgi:opacity protein-like surface antigen
MKKIFILCAVFLVFFSAALSAADVQPFTFSQAKWSAYGGPHIAYSNDIATLLVNPALLKPIKQIAFGQIGLGIQGDVFGLGGVAADLVTSSDGGKLDTRSLEKFTKDSGGKVPFGLDIRLPLASGYIGNGWGIGFFNRVYTDFSLIGTNVKAAANLDFMINFGMAFDFLQIGDHDLDWGFTTRLFNRETTLLRNGLLTIAQDADEFTKNIPFSMIFGGGLDLGLKYSYGKHLTAGLVLDDIISPSYIRNYTTDFSQFNYNNDKKFNFWGVNPRLNAGAAYTFAPLKWLEMSVMLDYRDIVNIFNNDYSTRNPILNLGIGTEITFIKHFSIRAGLNDMLPAIGLGFDISFFKLDFSYYGKELSNEPGGMSTYAFDLDFLFRY